MANYQETTVTGSEFTRCKEIHILNPIDLAPSIQFVEERATILGEGRSITQALGMITDGFDPAKVIALRNPETMELTGETVTHAEAYAILYSAYIQAAIDRDTAALN